MVNGSISSIFTVQKQNIYIFFYIETIFRKISSLVVVTFYDRGAFFSTTPVVGSWNDGSGRLIS